MTAHDENYWMKEYYQLLRKYDALMTMYEKEVGPLEDIVAFEKKMMEDFNEEE